jgi:hypothetical protein
MFIAASSLEAGTNRQMSQKSGAAQRPVDQDFTEKQGQYLAFIYTYTHMFRRPPAETDFQRHFRVSPPSVHQMIVTLERNGLTMPLTATRTSADALPSSCVPATR